MLTILRPALLLTVCCFAALVAEEGGSSAANPYLSMILGSGPVQYILILLSVVGVSVAIHRLLTVKPDEMVPEGLADDMHQILGEGVDDETYDDALNSAQGDGSMLGEIITSALDKRDFGFEAMRESAEMTAIAEQNKFMQQISWLSLLAAIGPMLGLLGTVIGMIGAFMEMASSPTGSVSAADLSGTIGGAMITTASGLIIAIPMMVAFFYLRAKVNKAVLDAGVLSGEVLDYFRPTK